MCKETLNIQNIMSAEDVIHCTHDRPRYRSPVVTTNIGNTTRYNSFFPQTMQEKKKQRRGNQAKPTPLGHLVHD